ncbi:toxin Cry1Ac domain D-VI-related protein [Candidatus Enterococcus mansonii]|uniref:Pesticidal crystal protein Cry1Aa domain-containing protein n=1 Tax=Candidatus Enterococcus mansonii TaxID=1834181 RepID=A0A242CI58_9ENTE|nr:toxin Cry1Ac domain D-VI-related protein [Enterococcus sp. 4G2_DIV0659]OTO09933.1 hypothetical protein A5880_000616 [Enterococcus sp. 4G2_DIV0659]
MIDFEHGIQESKNLVEELFTDNTHTAIRLSTTQIRIDTVKQMVNDLFDPTIKSELLTEIAKAQKNFILEKSNANAWDINTWVNKKDDIKLQAENIKKEPGLYEVIITLGQLKKAITVELKPGELLFEKRPNEINFGEPTIKSKTQYISTDVGVNFLIKDNRFVQENWRLTTKLAQPFQTETGIKTNSTIVLKNNHTITPLDENKTVELFQSDSNQRSIELNYNNTQQQEFLLEMLPGSLLANKLYTAKIMWLIETGP